MNLSRSTIKIFISNTTGTIIWFLGLTFFARELGAHQMGVFFLFQALLGILSIPADLGIRGGVRKRLSEGKSPGGILSSAVLLKFAPLSLLISGILLLRHPINDYLGAVLAIYLAVAIVMQEFAQLAMEVLKGELRVGETAVPSLLRQTVYVTLGAVLVLMGFGVFALVYSLLAGLVVLLIWGINKISVKFGRPSLAHARSLLDYSKYAFISSVGGYLYNWLDVAVIGFFLTQSHVGAYEMAWRVTAVTMLFSRAIATTIFPQVSQWAAEDDTERIEAVIKKAITPSMLLVIPAFFGTLLFAREILGLVFGQEYTIAWVVLIVLMGDKAFQAIQVIVGQSLQAIDRPDLAARAALISLITNLVLNIVLVWQLGIIGAAIATVAASLLNDFLHAFYLSKFISLRFPWREISWCVLSSIGMAFVLLIAKRSIIIDDMLTLLGIVGLGAAIYAVFVLLLPSIRMRAIRQIQNILLS